MERKREKAGAAKETKITWGHGVKQNREKIWKDMRRETEGRKSPRMK